MKHFRFLSLAFIAGAMALSAGCTQIDTGNVGVEKSMGQTKKEIMPAGVHLTMFKSVTEVSGKEMVVSLEDLKPQTLDKISLADLDIDLYIQIDPAHASEIMMRWPGDLTEVKGEDGARVGINYVTRQAREAIYDAVTKFSSATIHTERTAIAANVVKALQKDLDESAGKGWFFVRSANVRTLKTDPALEASIKEAATRDFQIAAKEKEVILARAEAERKRVEAAGDADAIKLRASAISANGGAEYVQLQAIEKWNGVLPTTQAGGVTPFINVK
jgi:regulator of protease activity HflC (stomatin/prohibitin superfamily)